MKSENNWDICRIIEQAEILIENQGFDRASLARKLGFPSRYIADIKAGKSKNPSSGFILALINKLNFNPIWLETFEGEMLLSSAPAKIEDTGYKVPLLSQKVSCGLGESWENEDNIVDYIELIPQLTTGRHYAFKTSGSSMLGAGIRNGDYIIFDTEIGFIPIDDIYVFMMDGDLYCKRLEFDKLAGKLKIFSVREADLEKAELLKTIDLTDSSYINSFRIFGRMRCLIRPSSNTD